jgi:hypothetical protein
MDVIDPNARDLAGLQGTREQVAFEENSVPTRRTAPVRRAR